ncbi:MAG: valine--tRNA ligase [Armatimonadetes bacterium]|nr:valine--tRNA ligase [Armatimonadota bacterium]
MQEPTLSSKYDASQVESKWYARWDSAGLFEPDSNPGKPTYTITIPPPNITGSLHMGHALCYPLQDLFGRYRRMRGDAVLILPGQDHAGIATQSLIDKKLREEGTSATEIGREAFVDRTWEWRKESGGLILNQLRSLGCAFDWSKERFTLDDRYADAVLKVFIDWFNRGLIYRGKRVVNWDPVLKTSVSDIETERKLVQGKLYHIRYPFADGSGSVTVATTRPETMLADVAVAVHPKDERYKSLVGKTITLPLVEREIPLIEDEYADPEYGTGAVKITPGHDANDFEVGQRHDLPLLILFDESARITEDGGAYAGMSREEARKRIVADLEDQGLLEKAEPHEISVLVSDRSKSFIEPLASEQWFVRQTELAQEAIRVVEQGEVRFVPDRYTDVYLSWMKNIHDWCISRQLWWGHRIPVYYTEDGTAYAALSWEDAQSQASDKKIVRQDNDVLDTWFSSGLWPFATLGWPEKSDDLKNHYPTDVLVTARDIIYLWVARMIMMGLDLHGEIPFRTVYIYATVLTEDGQRMSKSLGTGIDPIEIIESRGADALRYALFNQTGSNQDMRYGERRIDEARNFCNKIWNATRFVLMNLDGFDGREPEKLEPVDQWLLSKLVQTENSVRKAFDEYDIQSATQALYRFFWTNLCDWYIEVSKARLASQEARHVPQWVLTTCLDAFLKMMHPIMPHITEEIYAHLPIEGKAEFLMQASWPVLPDSYLQPEAEDLVESWIESTRALRSLRADLGLAAMKSVPQAHFEGDLRGGEEIIAGQAWVEELSQGRPNGRFISITSGSVDFHLATAGLVDEATETARLTKQLARFKANLAKAQQKLANPNFVERAKPEVVEKEREAAKELEDLIRKTKERIEMFES